LSDNSIILKIQEILYEIFDESKPVFSNNLTSNDIDEWDSLNNIHLLVSIEKSFGIKFTSKEIESINNLGDIIEILKNNHNIS